MLEYKAIQVSGKVVGYEVNRCNTNWNLHANISIKGYGNRKNELEKVSQLWADKNLIILGNWNAVWKREGKERKLWDHTV